jgi:hypothetical protein
VTRVAFTVALALAALTPLRAQGGSRSQASATSAQQIDARHQIEAFESVLEKAVGLGGQMWVNHMQSPATPAPSNTRVEVLLTGQTSARGFRLEGYGAVFDVEFPSIRRSVAWTMSTLDRPDPELLAAMKELRRKSQGDADEESRQQMDRYIKSLEEQIQAYDARARNVSSKSESAPSAQAQMTVEDPRLSYITDLANALITAVLDSGAATGVGPDEWLTVAARESLDLRFLPDDPATTLIMRVKGSDLAALRDKQLTRDDARKRIEVKQY